MAPPKKSFTVRPWIEAVGAVGLGLTWAWWADVYDTPAVTLARIEFWYCSMDPAHISPHQFMTDRPEIHLISGFSKANINFYSPRVLLPWWPNPEGQFLYIYNPAGQFLYIRFVRWAWANVSLMDQCVRHPCSINSYEKIIWLSQILCMPSCSQITGMWWRRGDGRGYPPPPTASMSYDVFHLFTTSTSHDILQFCTKSISRDVLHLFTRGVICGSLGGALPPQRIRLPKPQGFGMLLFYNRFLPSTMHKVYQVLRAQRFIRPWFLQSSRKKMLRN